MNRLAWIEHVDSWRTFLEEAMTRTDDVGEGCRLERQLATLERLRYGAALNPAILRDFIGPESPEIDRRECEKFFLDLNNAQRLAVETALGDNALTLIQGPPGTGKTQVIAEICLQTLRKEVGARILVCSETHVAVNNLIGRVADYAKEYRILRIRDGMEDEDIEAFSVATIVASHLDRIASVYGNESLTGVLREEFSNVADRTLEKALALSSNIVGMTCNRTAAYDFRDSTEMFDLVIIDEVCKASLPEIISPMLVARKAVLVGDPKQLHSIFCTEEREIIRSIENCHLDEHTYINELFDRWPYTIFLDTQYRMCEQVGTLISEVFYGGQLKNGRDASNSDSLIWIDYTPTQPWPLPAEQVKDKPQIYNLEECSIIHEVLEKCISNDALGMNVAVMAPYRAQVDLLKESLQDKQGIEVCTVDKFQGRECDAIIFSVTRTTGPNRFVEDARRLNVALSRAREKVIIVGSLDYCKKSKLALLASIAVRCRVVRAEQGQRVDHIPLDVRKRINNRIKRSQD